MTLSLPCGKYSIYISEDYYKNFFKKLEDEKDDFLLRITYHNYIHDDHYISHKINKSNLIVDKYYILPDCNEIEIKKDGEFFNYLMNLNLDPYCIEILKKETILSGIFVKSFGDQDLYDSIRDLYHNYRCSNTIWYKYTVEKLVSFMKQMSEAVHFLHTIKVCHFDIKPENIRVTNTKNISTDNFGSRFRLIDFGFADEYPYYKYRQYGYGTLGYTVNHKDKRPDKSLPESSPDDWVTDEKNNKRYHSIDKNIITDEIKVYNDKLSDEDVEKIEKVDVFALGRTFFQLNFYLQNIISENEKSKIKYNLINDIIENMTKDSLLKRFSSKKMYIRIDML